MATYTYKAKVKSPNGSSIDVEIQAQNTSEAQTLLEMQYGKGNIHSVRKK